MPIVNAVKNDFVTSFLGFWMEFITDIPKLSSANETFYASLLGLEANYPREYAFFKSNKDKLLPTMAVIFQEELKFPKGRELKVNSLNAVKTTSQIRFDSTYGTEGAKLVKYLESVLPGCTVRAEDSKGMSYIINLKNPAPVNSEWIKALNLKLYKTYPELEGSSGFNYI